MDPRLQGRQITVGTSLQAGISVAQILRQAQTALKDTLEQAQQQQTDGQHQQTQQGAAQQGGETVGQPQGPDPIEHEQVEDGGDVPDRRQVGTQPVHRTPGRAGTANPGGHTGPVLQDQDQ